MLEEPPKRYNKVCPAHSVYDWGQRHLMREGDFICTSCYKKLPKEIKKLLFDKNPATAGGNVSIVVDWLLEREENG